MIIDNIKLDSIKGLNNLDSLIDFQGYIVLIQYEDIIDSYLIDNINEDTLKQLAYYLYIAYDLKLNHMKRNDRVTFNYISEIYINSYTETYKCILVSSYLIKPD